MKNFSWITFDVNHLLPHGWTKMITDIAEKHRVDKVLLPKHSTCRETSETGVKVANVNGSVLKKTAPWLYKLYATKFAEFAKVAANREIFIARDEMHAAVLNIQNGTQMRYEAHVDTNPIEGLLYVTTHKPGEGGELVVANEQDCNSIAEIENNCSRIYPVSGNLVFFDGRMFPHYVAALKNDEHIRIVVAMNFYTEDSPESMRPPDLSLHLKGYPQSGTQQISL